MKNKPIAAILASLLFAVWAPAADDIKIGMTGAMSGPSKELGLQMKLGLETCFDAINSQGGIGDRKIKLVALDDGYESEEAEKHVRKLIDEEKVIALVGCVGTPTAMETVPIAIEKKTLFFGGFTGAKSLLRDPPDRYVINFRASYAQETEKMIAGLLEIGIRPFEIAFFTQEGPFGKAGYTGATDALKKRGYKTEKLVRCSYTRNTVDVDQAVLEIVHSKIPPRAVIMIGAYQPSAKFIRIVKRVLPKALFLNVSFVGSTALARELGEKVEGVIATQVIPHFASDAPLAQEYLRLIRARPDSPEPTFVSFEGFAIATVLVEGLKKVSGEIGRESVIDAIESLGEFDVGLGEGAELSLGRDRRQASNGVWLTALKDGKFVEITWPQIKKQLPRDPAKSGGTLLKF